MADERYDPIASTAAFRAFSDNDGSGSSGGGSARRGPGTLVYITAIVALAALVLGVLAFAL